MGETIRACRKNIGFSQEKLAEKADLHPVYISMVERGVRTISVDALIRIANALKVPIGELFRDF